MRLVSPSALSTGLCHRYVPVRDTNLSFDNTFLSNERPRTFDSFFASSKYCSILSMGIRLRVTARCCNPCRVKECIQNMVLWTAVALIFLCCADPDQHLLALLAVDRGHPVLLTHTEYLVSSPSGSRGAEMDFRRNVHAQT